MLSLNRVRKVEVERRKISTNSGKADHFHAVTLKVSYDVCHSNNTAPETFQINLMSEKEIPILEAAEEIKPPAMLARVVYYIKNDPKHLFISEPNGNGVFDGTTLLGGIHDKSGKRLKTWRIDYSKLTPVSPHIAEQVLVGYAKLEKEFNENEEAGMRTLTEPEAWEGGIADNE